MLRFRPIAPKPVTGRFVSGDFPTEKINGGVTKARAKRKYSRAKKKSKKNEDKADRVTTVTLHLLPEISGPSGGSDGDSVRLDLSVDRQTQLRRQTPDSLNFNGFGENCCAAGIVVPDPTVADSHVTVETITDVYMDGGGLGRTDVERINNLGADTCPGFVSDGENKVRWINPAYGEMTCSKKGIGGAVRLVVKGELPVEYYRAFACRVRVQYTWRGEKRSQILPCDVCRMDFGGLAWRLDLDAALSLGR